MHLESEPAGAALQVSIRCGRHSDLPQVGQLWQELMDFHIDMDPRYETARGAREAFTRYLAASVLRSRDHQLFIAEVQGRVVGFLVARVEYGGPIFKEPNHGYITDACVHGQYRRSGVGKKLFEACRDWFKGRGLKNIRVSVASTNPISQEFWKGVGFKPFMERLWYDLE